MLLKIIKWTFATLNVVAAALLVEIFKREFFGAPTATQTLPNGFVFPALVANHKIFFCLTIFALLGVVTRLAFHLDAIKQLRDKGSFYRSTHRLRPSDINPGRAWYNPLFVARPQVERTVELLTKGEGVASWRPIARKN